MEDEFAAWGGGIDLFRKADELDATLFEALEQLDQMRKRTSCPIQFPDY
jgi:hypothetical protein